LRRSKSRLRRLISRVLDKEAPLILTEPSGVRKLRWDLVFVDKMAEKEIPILLRAWVYANQSLKIGYDEYSGFDLSTRAAYMKDLEDKLAEWFYDKYMMDHTDDLSEEQKDAIEQQWFNWQDIIELVLHADYFDLLFRFIDEIAETDNDIARIEVIRRRVIIHYGSEDTD
jgi:hypothetical protein